MTMECCSLGPALLSLEGVEFELQIVKHWAFDLVLLRLASVSATAKVSALVNKDVGSASVLRDALYFPRLKLFDVNTKKEFCRDRTFCLGVDTLAHFI